MKPYGILCVAVAVIMLLAPLVSISLGAPSSSEEITSQEDESVMSSDSFAASNTISVFLSSSDSVENMDIKDYIIGAVAAEMPASYESEALKAQALAAVTFARYMQNKGGDEKINGADISDDAGMHQGYISKEEMREKWGDAFGEYYEKIENAVSEVIGKVITYDGEVIMAAYHAISSGKTESAANAWGKDIPYLVSVESECDRDSPRYSSEEIFTFSELRDALKDEDGIDFTVDESDFIEIKNTTDAGTVTKVSVGGKDMTGAELRSLLQLRSPVFSVEYESGNYTFSVSGYGHGVGMSQYGADCMAKQGKSYEEIIAHYYPGTQIEEI